MQEPEQQPHLNTVNIREAISRLDSSLPIEIIDNPNSPRIQEVAELDAELFGTHKSLKAEDFKAIIENGGAIFGHINKDSKLVSEASLILNADPEHGMCSLERGLPKWLAYCDGAAVGKEYRGKGLEKELLEAREAVAKETGKQASSTSVRHGNLASIKSMLKNGYLMVADAPGYYGPNPEDDRVVMLKMFDFENPLQSLTIEDKALDVDQRGLTQTNNIDAEISRGAELIAINAQQSDEVDEKYNHSTAKLLRSGYIGIASHDLDIGDSDGERENAMVFVQLDTLGEHAPELKQKCQELQVILDSGNNRAQLTKIHQSLETSDSAEVQDSGFPIRFTMIEIGHPEIVNVEETFTRLIEKPAAQYEGAQISRVLVKNIDWAQALQSQDLHAYDDVNLGMFDEDLYILGNATLGRTKPKITAANHVHLDKEHELITVQSRDAEILTLSAQDAIPTILRDPTDADESFDILVGHGRGLSFNMEPAYNGCAAVREVYDALGFSNRSRSNVTYPLPVRFKRVWEELRSGGRPESIYLPDIKFFEDEGEIPGETYLKTWAEGRYPASGAKVRYYLHDLAKEHMMALMVYGEPLMQFMQQYAAAALEAPEITITHVVDEFFSGNEVIESTKYTGTKKIDQAAGLVDRVTTVLASELKPHTNHARSIDVVNNMLTLLKDSGMVLELQVVQELIKAGTIADAASVTATHVADWFIQNAQKNMESGNPSGA